MLSQFLIGNILMYVQMKNVVNMFPGLFSVKRQTVVLMKEDLRQT